MPLACLLQIVIAASPPPLVVLEDEAPASVPVVRAETEPATEEEPLAHLGLALDVGAPSGAGVALLARPWCWLKLRGGPAYNGISWGGRAGLDLGYFRSPFTPTLSAEAGRFAAGDASDLVRRIGGEGVPLYPSLKRVGYDFAQAQLGFELGSPGAVTFFVRGGLAWLRAQVHDVGATARQATGDDSLDAQDIRLTAVVPSAQLGLTVYLR